VKVPSELLARPLAEDMTESMVRQWLREHQGSAHCARCVARGLSVELSLVKGAMDELAPRPIFSQGPCACGEAGLRYGLPVASAGQ
jgi:hypothetical protein